MRQDIKSSVPLPGFDVRHGDDQPRDGQAFTPPVKLDIRHVSFRYGDEPALTDVSLPIYANKVTALIGPSGCGKSTLLRVLNRMPDLYEDQHVEGEVLLDGVDILGHDIDVLTLRRRVGMVTQKPSPFPMSIYDNVAIGMRLNEELTPTELDARVEDALRRAALWEEVRDILKDDAQSLSGGQQQRLCLARTMAVRPEVILLDEPCSALDPISTAKIEATIEGLKPVSTIVIVTHNLQQAARIADYTAFLYLGSLIEFGPTEQVFENSVDERTSRYVTGRMG
ncbi:phosphate ABC transporter, ATPase subunit [Ancylobacter novellus DSM 506]|uniref:Phosphate ABC transporter, ATPase subunit n=1 Tax=Ancylobacter novellus (strain ATCC 8093 / DSM 506 / JCM 20403 / CCM 1077 / IAM 12100 / NBRC 12443 / NCIMB 10456) TaxID=639283 RepID=D7A7B7_ANCN5|nr:phosphate ABC transporter ATP-binding protein PstB [Ancylobacter novellus]ADH90348.1 phosphate ABC transporter, ATPase subunit [Ancylobacter novellus DSM 506]